MLRAQSELLEIGPRLKLSKAALAGLIGGIVMAMVAMMITAALGIGLWAMPAMIGGLVLGPQAAMSGGAGVIVVGLMAHMMLSAMFGAVFGLIVEGRSFNLPVVGMAFGLALWIVNFYVIGAFWDRAAVMSLHEPAWLAAMTHLIFGFVTGYAARRLASK